jgi:hypothetical protein
LGNCGFACAPYG